MNKIIKQKTEKYYKQYKFNVRCTICNKVFGKGYSWNFRSKVCMNCEEDYRSKKVKKRKKLEIKNDYYN